MNWIISAATKIHANINFEPSTKHDLEGQMLRMSKSKNVDI